MDKNYGPGCVEHRYLQNIRQFFNLFLQGIFRTFRSFHIESHPSTASTASFLVGLGRSGTIAAYHRNFAIPTRSNGFEAQHESRLPDGRILICPSHHLMSPNRFTRIFCSNVIASQVGRDNEFLCSRLSIGYSSCSNFLHKHGGQENANMAKIDNRLIGTGRLEVQYFGYLTNYDPVPAFSSLHGQRLNRLVLQS